MFCPISREKKIDMNSEKCIEYSGLRARIRPHPRLFRGERRMCTGYIEYGVKSLTKVNG